jgi:hypothetical protein
MKCKGLVIALAASIVACFVLPAGASALVPANGGDVGGSIIAINTGPGGQLDPRVSGDLAAYTDTSTASSGEIHYYDFLTSIDHVIPASAPGDMDTLSDVSGTRISFARQTLLTGQRPVVVYDMVDGSSVTLTPPSAYSAFRTAIAGNTVAFLDNNTGNGDIEVADVSAPAAPLTNLSVSPTFDGNQAIAPDGNLVVWEACNGSFTNCDIQRSRRAGGTWGAPTIVAATLYNESNPDTDGVTIVYDSDRPSATGQDIYFQPVGGGGETQITLTGIQRDPGIANGVISFESKDAPSAAADLFVYVIATNMLYRVTNSGTVDESLNDLDVLPSGDVRLVWAANDGPLGEHNIYARTFTVPLTPPPFTATVQQPINGDGSSVFKASRGVIPVKFTLAVSGSPTCTLPPATIAVTRLAGSITGAVNESDYLMAADAGSSFRIDGCQYVYNLNAKSMSTGVYRVEILIDGTAVGSATFELR